MSSHINSNYNYAFTESSKRQKTAGGYSAEGSNDADLRHKAADGGLGDYFSYIQEANREIMMREGEGIQFSSVTIENGPFLPPSITENLFSEAKAKPKVSFAQLLQDHPQIFQDYDICSASDLEITLMPNPDALTASDGDDGVNAIRCRLEGYDHFVVRLNQFGQIEIINRVCFEERLALWAKGQNSDRIEEVVRRIQEAFDLNATELDLRSCDLTSLPCEISKLWNLKSLNLQRNDLTTLPSEIGMLLKLERLDVKENEVTSLPPAIGNLAHLRSLDLSGNPLQSLPVEIIHLIKLEEFHLDIFSLNEAYLVWRLATLPEEAPEKEKLQLMVQAAKTRVFRRALLSLIGEQETVEGIEIYLYYEAKLQEEFDLLIAMKNPKCKTMGEREWIENSLVALKEKVEAEFMNEMLEFAPLQKMVEADWGQAKKAFEQRLEAIESNMTDENTYLTQMNQLSHRAFVKNWLEGRLQLLNYQ